MPPLFSRCDCSQRKRLAAPLPPLFAVQHSAQRSLVCPSAFFRLEHHWCQVHIAKTSTHLMTSESLAPVNPFPSLGHVITRHLPQQRGTSPCTLTPSPRGSVTRNRHPKGTVIRPFFSWHQNHFRLLSSSMQENSILWISLQQPKDMIFLRWQILAFKGVDHLVQTPNSTV